MIINADITLYNSYVDDMERTKYKKTIIKGVNWQGAVTKMITNNTLQSADSINVFIPFLADFSGKTYLEPKEWFKLSESAKDNYFTFKATDRIVKGQCDFEFIGINTVKNLDNSYDNVISIMSVVKNDNGSPSMQHFMIGGK
ncbi:DUF6751 family protein [Clostridium sp. 'White wine YQ']|uniref:DUF6751 family protein n=1 Tax=Clostridium sp. 'White wine YQ' TaxID=3027474 RepID=UPI0023658616|nr:DUF6751 family protein [Clostridium sp. 'White wine YQ']MDD7793692.1 hypothetical protein [Clostridium sp. 'White wine YQ']